MWMASFTHWTEFALIRVDRLGQLSGPIVTCPWHGFQFDVCSGQHQTSQSLTQPGFPVKVEGDEVYIDLTGAAEN